MHDEGRRYRILGLIGSGGFGRVYRARLETEGFTKEVAIKVISAADPEVDVLQRFRDEARMLGLVRDRAIVAAEPPVRLGGHWAVVMEFVDGCTLGRLIAAHGPVPPSVALEIVGEIARALDKVFHHPGPSGEPLGLLHRDLKPANLQVTAHGEVKILDFGVARAQMEDREAKTQGMLVGTYDYMAPERLQGIEEPAGDVYSLGRVLEEMLLGRRRVRGDPRVEPADAEDPALKAALQLGNEMTRLDHEARPGPRDVEHRCEVLLAATGRNPSLRSWAERAVPEVSIQQTEDALVGELLTETGSSSGRPWPLGEGPSGAQTRRLPIPPLGLDLDVAGEISAVPEAPARATGLTWGLFGVFGGVLLVVAAGSLAAGMLMAGLTTLAFFRGVAEPTSDSLVGDPIDGFHDAAAPSSPNGRPGDDDPLLEIPGLAPPSDTATDAQVPTGTRADLIMGQGRASVLELGMLPTEFRVTRGVEVVQAPPYLVLGGAAGRGRLTVAFEGGEREWVFDVSRDPKLDPDGGPSLVKGSERMTLLEGVGAVCTLPVAPRATILMDEARATLIAMGRRGVYVQADSGMVDVVFDVEGEKPRVLTIDAVAMPPEGEDLVLPEPPEGCVLAPVDIVRIPVGGEIMLPVGQVVSHLVVGDPDRFEVLRVEDDETKIRIRALRLGQTAVAVSDIEGAEVWIRRVIAE